MTIGQRLFEATNTLAKWRTVFAWWQVGKDRTKGDPQFDAVCDQREMTMLMRAELNALVGVLVERGVFTTEAYCEAVIKECSLLSTDYQKKFPGFQAKSYGMSINVSIAKDTMATWK